MIINRYILRNIFSGTASALLLLVGLALFFTFVRELDDLGKNGYGIRQVLGYIALSVPGKVVEFLPLAVLLGSMLSLGSLASNSELIAMQASGITLQRMLGAVLQAGLIIALVGFLLADWVLPDSEINARKLKKQSRQQTSALETGKGLWLKDESKVVHVAQLLPNGYARKIEIYHLDGKGGLKSLIKAESAQPLDGGWELYRVSQTLLSAGEASSQQFEQLIYPGNLSHELLQVLLVGPRQMSSRDLYAYISFLDESHLDAEVERLIFWQKMFAPVTIIIMCFLAFPFVLGSQRQSNTGQRLLIGILLGLSFAVIDRVLTQIGTQYGINALTVVLMPHLLFFALAVYLFARKSGRGSSLQLFARLLRR